MYWQFQVQLTLWPHTQWCKQRWCVPRAMVAPVTQLTECACAHLDLQGSIVLVRKCDTSWLKYKCILCRVCCSVGGLTLRNDPWSLELTLCLDCDSSGWTDACVSTKSEQRRKRESWVVLVLDMHCLSSLCARYGSTITIWIWLSMSVELTNVPSNFVNLGDVRSCRG